MMNSQTVLDSQNKYRFGVKIGNWQEELYGKDQVLRENDESTPPTLNQTHFHLSHLQNQQRLQVNPVEKEQHLLTKFDQHGEKAHILLGHGINDSDFFKRDFKTTSELSYQHLVHSKQQINPKFEPVQTRNPVSFQREQDYKNNYQKNILPIGEVSQDKKVYRDYAEYTKQFDATWTKTGLRQ